MDYKSRIHGGYQAKLIDYEKEKQISELLESLGPDPPEQLEGMIKKSKRDEEIKIQ